MSIHAAWHYRCLQNNGFYLRLLELEHPVVFRAAKAGLFLAQYREAIR